MPDGAVDAHDDTGDEWCAQGDLLLKQDRFREALDLYTRVLEQHPDEPAAWTGKASALLNLDHPTEALIAYDRALALDPASMTTWHDKGGCLKNLGRDDEALACYDHVLELAPDDGEAIGERAGALYNLERYDEALAGYNRALELISSADGFYFTHTTYWKGRTLYELGRDEEALSCFGEVLARSPDDSGVTVSRAHALYYLGRFEEALVAYDRAQALTTGLLDLWHDKGMTLHRLGRFDEALACFDRALQHAPDNPEAAEYRAHSLVKLRCYDEALTAYDLALALNPDAHDLWHDKGLTLCRLKRDDEALACFDRALELAPDSGGAAEMRAGVLYRLQRYNEAQAAYDFALKLALPERHARLNYWRGMTLQRLKRYQEALAAYDQALSLDDQHADWWRERGRTCFVLRRFEAALVDFERAIALDADNSDGWFLKGGSLLGLGRNEEALAALEQTLRLAPANGLAWWSKGEALNSLCRYQEAGAAFDEGVRLRPDDTELQRRYRAVMLPIRRTTTDQRLKLRDGRWLGYLDYGDPDGVPIICCHGAPGSRLSVFCDPNLLLDLHLRLIVPDRPGYGLSDFQRRRRLLDWPGDVEQLADHLGLERFALLGVSAGGPHAAACAFAIPHRLIRVGLVSSAAPRQFTPMRHFRPRERISNIVGRYLPWPLQWALYSAALWLLRKSPAFMLRAISERTIPADKAAIGAADLGDWPGTLPPTIREEVLEPFRRGARGHAWDVRLCARRWRFRPDAIRGVPVYLWHGERDQLVPVAAARALAAAIPGSRATFYPADGHDLREHTGEIFTTLIADERHVTAG